MISQAVIDVNGAIARSSDDSSHTTAKFSSPVCITAVSSQAVQMSAAATAMQNPIAQFADVATTADQLNSDITLLAPLALS